MNRAERRALEAQFQEVAERLNVLLMPAERRHLADLFDAAGWPECSGLEVLQFLAAYRPTNAEGTA